MPSQSQSVEFGVRSREQGAESVLLARLCPCHFRVFPWRCFRLANLQCSWLFSLFFSLFFVVFFSLFCCCWFCFVLRPLLNATRRLLNRFCVSHFWFLVYLMTFCNCFRERIFKIGFSELCLGFVAFLQLKVKWHSIRSLLQEIKAAPLAAFSALCYHFIELLISAAAAAAAAIVYELFKLWLAKIAAHGAYAQCASARAIRSCWLIGFISLRRALHTALDRWLRATGHH